MKKVIRKVITILLPCLLLTGCVSKTDYDAAVSERDRLWENVQEESEEYGLFSTAFDTDLCGALNQERSVYQVVIDRQRDLDDLLSCLNKFESLESEFENGVTGIYVTYVSSDGRPEYSIYVCREKFGDHFDAPVSFQ